jgi:putative transposase
MVSLLRSEVKERGMKRRFSEEQIIQILREGETAPTKAEVCRKYGISEWTYYRWQR